MYIYRVSQKKQGLVFRGHFRCMQGVYVLYTGLLVGKILGGVCFLAFFFIFGHLRA